MRRRNLGEESEEKKGVGWSQLLFLRILQSLKIYLLLKRRAATTQPWSQFCFGHVGLSKRYWAGRRLDESLSKSTCSFCVMKVSHSKVLVILGDDKSAIQNYKTGQAFRLTCLLPPSTRFFPQFQSCVPSVDPVRKLVLGGPSPH